MRREAERTSDAVVRQGFLDIAASYEKMAEQIDKEMGVPLARAIEKPVQPQPSDIAATVDPTPPPEPEPSN